MPFAASLVAVALLSPRPEIAAAGSATPRPEICRPAANPMLESTLWTRLRPAELRRFCTLLARGYARLVREPAQALELARAAAKLGPSDDALTLLEGRALFRLGRSAEAWKVLGPLFAKAPLEDAPSLHDTARAALAAGELDAAERAYRRLVPRVGLLGSGEARRIAYVEAASLLIARGATGIDEALGYLAEARALALSGDRDLVLSLTALALSRAGRSEQARAAARETDGPWDLENELSPRERARVAAATLSGEATEGDEPAAVEPPRRVMLMDGELHAAIAILAEGRDAASMRDHVRAFLASPAGRGVWAEHAKRLLAQGRGGR